MKDFFAEEGALQEQVLKMQKQAGHARGRAGALWRTSHFTDKETGTE